MKTKRFFLTIAVVFFIIGINNAQKCKESKDEFTGEKIFTSTGINAGFVHNPKKLQWSLRSHLVDKLQA